METIVFVVIGLVVAVVAIDAIGRLDERRPRPAAERRKITVDLRKR
jgi:hypothetical protein